jgi:hypothetical protein
MGGHLEGPFDGPLTHRFHNYGNIIPVTRGTRWGRVAMLEALIDAPRHQKGLTVFPVIAPQGPMLPYLLSTEIQGSGLLTVRQRGEGTTPMLLARNNSLHALLILAGEPLPGGDPGRLVERSILLAGKHVTQIPASSLETGGWVSPDREAELTEWITAFPLQHRQVGCLVCHGNRILGLEALGSANLYRLLHRRLLIRFMKEALSNPIQSTGDPRALEAEAQNLVESLEAADRVATKRVGLGDHRSLSGSVSGGELIHQGHLVHLSVRPVPEVAGANTGGGGVGQCS